jgi:DNA-binding PadR family transcriptional regulator
LTHYNDKILELTPEWISTNQLIAKMHGNKTLILENIKSLESDGYLVMTQEGNKKLYKRDDNGDSELGFIGIMKLFKDNQKTELDVIEHLVTLSFGYKYRLSCEIHHIDATGWERWNYKLTKDGKELLDHIKSEVDRAYIVMVRMNYQAKIRLITQKIADERIKLLQQHIDKIMTALTSKFYNKYDKYLIKEHFQNHVTRLEFKI